MKKSKDKFDVRSIIESLIFLLVIIIIALYNQLLAIGVLAGVCLRYIYMMKQEIEEIKKNLGDSGERTPSSNESAKTHK